MPLIQTNSLGSLFKYLRKVLLAVLRTLCLTNCIISAVYKSSIFPTIPYIEQPVYYLIVRTFLFYERQH